MSSSATHPWGAEMHPRNGKLGLITTVIGMVKILARSYAYDIAPQQTSHGLTVPSAA